MKAVLYHLAEKIHFKLFGHKMSQEMKQFLGNLSWSVSSGVIAVGISTVVTTLAGRFMGPEEYGKYSLLLVVYQFLVIFIFLGIDITSVKYIAKAKDFFQKKKIVSSFGIFIALSLGIVCILSVLTFPLIRKLYSVNLIFLLAGLSYTIFVSIKTAFDLFTRGLEDFKRQAKAKIFEALILLLAFPTIFFLLKLNNFIGLIATICVGAIGISLYYLVYLKKYLGAGDRRLVTSKLSETNLYFLSGLLGTIFLTADRIVVANYLGVKMLGVYSAYYLASYGVVAQINLLFNNVFLPATSRIKEKTYVKKIDRFFLISFIPVSIIFALVMLVMLLIFGKDYPMNAYYIIFFSVFSSLFFFQSLYNTIIVDASKKLYARYVYGRNLINLLSLGLYGVMIFFKLTSILFIIINMIVNLIIVIIFQKKIINKMHP
jgi:O-antigen/teichoic acid export membrane protein